MNDSLSSTASLPTADCSTDFPMSTPRAKVVSTEPRLRANADFCRNLIERTDNLVTQVDAEGRFTFVNHASRIVFGVEPERCIGLPAFDFIHPDDRQKTRAWLTRCVQEKKTNACIENRQIGRLGNVHHMNWTANLRFDRSGKVIEISSIARDVTKAKMAEETLHEQAHFVVNNPAPLMRADCEGRVLSWNPAAEALFGPRLNSESVIDLIPNLCKSALDLVGDSPIYAEQAIARKVYRFAIRKAGEGDSIYLHGSDITERKRIEQQLDTERTALRESNAALRSVMARIEDEKCEIREAIARNVEKVLVPVLRALEHDAAPHQMVYIALLKKHLDELTSPFVNRLSKTYASLTPTEIEVCEMIRDGLSSKEIARVRHVSPATVAKQRERIRRKLRLAGTDTNLATHLSMFATADK